MGRVLAASLLLHALVGVALARLRVPAAGRSRAPLEVMIRPSLRPPAPVALAAVKRPSAARVRIAGRTAAPTEGSAAPMPLTPQQQRAASEPPRAATPAPPAAPPVNAPPVNAPPVNAPPVNLFAPSALAGAAGISIAPTAADRAWRPRRGVGGESGAGGTDVGSFLAEDAARMRAGKGAVAPELRTLERRLDEVFTPSFIQADVSNRGELFFKQLRGFWRNPPKTGELARTTDPTKETTAEKIRSMRPEQAFFLGRRVEVFVRQKLDGTIVEMALRNASGYRAFDDAALVAVEKALVGRVPGVTRGGGDEVRTLWQLDATAYVVVSPEPQLVFDESSGKNEWIYPLQKRVDHHVRLVAVY